MIQQLVSPGDKVQYHGSQASAHGIYYVRLVPYNPAGRGYVLANALDPDNPDRTLYNVHRDSFTLVSTG